VNLDPQIAHLLAELRVPSGVVVVSTMAGAIDVRDGGLAEGDIIYAVNRTPVKELSELRAAVDALKQSDPVVLQIERHGELMYLALTVE
jgi:S1-C subfamily serine protease